MSTPIPNITGGAATAGDIRSGVDVRFAPVSVGGLFGSTASASSPTQMLLHIGVGVAVGFFAAQFLRRRR